MSELNEQILDAWIHLTTAINNERIVSEMPLNEALICRILYKNQESEITATDLCALTKMQKVSDEPDAYEHGEEELDSKTAFEEGQKTDSDCIK